MSDDDGSPSVPKSRKRAVIESDEEEEEEEEELEGAPTVNAENVRAQDANGNSDGEVEEEVGVGHEALEKDEGGQGGPVPDGSDDEAGEGDLGAVERDQQPAEEDELAERKKKKQKKKDEGDRKPKKRRKSSDVDKEARKRKQPREKKMVRLKKGDGEGEEELFSFLEKEAGSEDDSEGERTAADVDFIDDAGAKVRYDSEDEYGGDPSRAPQAEEAEEDDGGVDALFGKGKKNKKSEKSPEELAYECQEFVMLMGEAAETDAESNRAGKPALKKLQMLPNVVNTVSKKPLQHMFMQYGVLSALKQWLEPLPDRSLPNIAIRTAVLRILSGMPIDTSEPDVRDWLKDSYLGRVVMFLSRLPDESADNRAVARDLVDKWSRPIFKKSTNYEELRHREQERPPPPRQKAAARRQQAGDDEHAEDFDASSLLKPGDLKLHASIPQPATMDYKRRSQSKVSAEEANALSKNNQVSEKAKRMDKTLQRMRRKPGNMRAEKVSVEGRGLIKYI